MWGNIILEYTYSLNFNFGFLDNSSDMLINLTHWQYWWWFWFNYFLVLYYLLAIRVVRFRLLKFNPKIVTSFRSHGKWGDLIVCLIPISWCVNIILNSNLLLRVLEWQGEAGFFTVRVRGRQWYWVYKFELKSIFDVFNTNKNIGYNRLILFNHTNLKMLSRYHYYNAQKLNSDDVYLYWEQHNTYPEYIYSSDLKCGLLKKLFFKKTKFYPKIRTMFKNGGLRHTSSLWRQYKKIFIKLYSSFKCDDFFDVSYSQYSLHDLYRFSRYFLCRNFEFLSFGHVAGGEDKNYFDFIEDYRHFKKINTTNFLKIKVLKNTQLEDGDLLTIDIKSDNNFTINKVNTKLFFLVLKQKRYKPKFIYNYLNDTHYLNVKNQRYMSDNCYKVLNKKSLNYRFNTFKGVTTLLNSKRLLRVKRTLVLPAHLNISVITNSFDVVHSWYIPGLGIKMDCVPGRSTHHNIYINHYGFYYGQCAEICGRYHHHMPIRVCALPFEHFLIWWHSYAVNIYTNFIKDRTRLKKTSVRFYTW